MEITAQIEKLAKHSAKKIIESFAGMKNLHTFASAIERYISSKSQSGLILNRRMARSSIG